MRFLKQSTSVDVVIGPVWATADGAFKGDLAYNASGINCDIYKNGTKADITLANSAGDGYFRAGSGEAQYILTLSTGHTDTLGMARITLSATGYAMKPEDFMVVPANVWDSLFGSDKLDVNAAEVSGDSGAADALEDFFDDATSVTNFKAMYDGTGYAGGTIKTKVDLETIKTQAVTCGAGVTVLASVGTAATATAQTGDAYAIVSNGTYGLAAIKTLIDAFATDADIAQATWDALLTAITTDGSVGKLIKDYLDAAVSTRSTYAGGAVDSVTGSVGSVAAGGISNASFAADVGSTAYASNIIALAVRKVLDELNLDHLAKTATAAADMTTEVADNTILSRILANGDTSAFDPSTDSLEAQSVQAAATSLLLNAVHKGSFQAAADTPSAGYTTWTLYDLDDNLIATFVTTDATGSRAKAT